MKKVTTLVAALFVLNAVPAIACEGHGIKQGAENYKAESVSDDARVAYKTSTVESSDSVPSAQSTDTTDSTDTSDKQWNKQTSETGAETAAPSADANSTEKTTQE